MEKVIVDVNGNKVVVENGDVKTVFNETIQKCGIMSVEDGKRITLEAIKMILKRDGR